MIIAMRKDATHQEVEMVMSRISEHGLKPVDLPGGDRTAIGIASAIPSDLREPLTEIIESLPGVDHVTQVSRAYKLASREFHPGDTIVKVKDATFGPGRFTVIAGPCAIEGWEQLISAARAVKEAGAGVLRGGAFKPRSSPYSFQGLGEEGLRMLQQAGEEVGLPTVTEIIDPHDIDLVAEYCDILQIGARNMQNFPLLTAVGKANKPVLLKRGPSATIDEWLLSAEYILCQGSEDVILCERGVHPLDRTYTRYTLDILAVPVVKAISHLPIIIDPSHAAGNWKWVSAMSRAALAAGADGLLIEVHPEPSRALCDGSQSLKTDSFAELMESLSPIAQAVGQKL